LGKPSRSTSSPGRIDGYYKGRVTMASAKLDQRVAAAAGARAGRWRSGVLIDRFNFAFITAPDASGQRPEAAGLGVAIVGSFYMMLVVLALSLPIGVAASIYLEEFAPKNRFTDLIEVNISNLAAVPSIVFGILGLATFINFRGLPQSAPIVGGLVLTLMTLPTIIIATRASLKAVPPSIREAALGVGASKMQSVFTTSCRWPCARHPDRHDHRPCAGTGRNRAAAADRHGGLRARVSGGAARRSSSMPPPPCRCRSTAGPSASDPAFVERASGAIIVLLVFLIRHERDRNHSAAAVRASVVRKVEDAQMKPT
jgi:phosphate transport system permease protein